jgi:Flp pilus assembly protein TadG
MVRWNDERGLLGKLAIAWLIVAVLIVVGLVDGASILVTRLHLSDVASAAAIAGATDLASSHDATHACAAAAASIQVADHDIKLGKGFCTVDVNKGDVTITLHKTAKTILAGRLGFTKHWASVRDVETNGPSDV